MLFDVEPLLDRISLADSSTSLSELTDFFSSNNHDALQCNNVDISGFSPSRFIILKVP